MRSRTWSKTTAACAPTTCAASARRFRKAAAWPCSMIREVRFPLVRHQQLSLVIAAALEQGRSGRTAQEVGVYIAKLCHARPTKRGRCYADFSCAGDLLKESTKTND